MLDPIHSTEYFTGAQVRIYFGSIFIDEIASIEWAGNNSKRPVYGYASALFDAVAQGQYLVQGAFIVPFKEVGFLYSVQRQLTALEGNTQAYLDKIRNTIKQPDKSLLNSSVSGTGPKTTIKTRVRESEGQEQEQEVLASLGPADLLAEEAQEGGQAYKDLLDAYESKLWDTSFVKEDRILRPDEFDLDPSQNFIKKGFNILVTFGDVNNPNTPSTAKSLIDVHITSDQRLVDTSDNTIYEQYTFFCRSADESLGAYYNIPGTVGTSNNTDASQQSAATDTLRSGHDAKIETTKPTEATPAGEQQNKWYYNRRMEEIGLGQRPDQFGPGGFHGGMDIVGDRYPDQSEASSVFDKNAETIEPGTRSQLFYIKPPVEIGQQNWSAIYKRLAESSVPAYHIVGPFNIYDPFIITRRSYYGFVDFVYAIGIGPASGKQDWIILDEQIGRGNVPR